MPNPIIERLKSTITIDADHSRIKISNTDIAYHCDKFATRITKGLEDVLGFEETVALINKYTAESMMSTLEPLAKAPTFTALPVSEKLDTLLEIYKMLGNGAVTLEKSDGTSTKAHTKYSYLAESFIENMDRWQWKFRSEPFCHEMSGNLCGAFAISTGKELANISVKEVKCRTMGADECVFEVEVK